MRPAGSPEELQRRRRRAIALLREGVAPVDVASRVGVDRRSVRRWNAAFRRHGAAGIAPRPTPGRPCALTETHKRRLERLLLKGAQGCGFATDLWTCVRVAELIRSRFGVQYHVDHIGRLLHALGWSPQKPTRLALERDEAAIARWIKEDWPRVKKTPPAATRRSSSSTKRAS